METEESVVENIRLLTDKLNAEFQAAHRLGLKAHVSGNSAFAYNGISGARINVHVWREIELLQVPNHANPKIHQSFAVPPEVEAKREL